HTNGLCYVSAMLRCSNRPATAEGPIRSPLEPRDDETAEAMSTAKKASTAQQDVLAPLAAAVTAGKETVEAVLKAGTDAYAKHYEQTVSMTKEHVEKTSNMLFQNYDELVALNKANLDAVVATTTTVANGFETLAKELMGFAQGN